MMISKFYLKQKILGVNDLMGGKLGGGVLGSLHAMGGILGGLKWGVVWELCVRPYIYKRVLFTYLL